jgi:hypothetical protein
MFDDETTGHQQTEQAEIDALWEAYLAPAESEPIPNVVDESIPDRLRPNQGPSTQAAPLAAGPQAQGDLLFLPGGWLPHWAQHIPTSGVDLVSTGNGHRLAPRSGRVWYAAVHDDPHVIAVLEVEESAVVTQPRGRDAHAPLVLGPGLWQVRQQTEVDAASLGFRRVVD